MLGARGGQHSGVAIIVTWECAMTPVRPIETKYAGHLFRSRTEARWAVFFDAAGIEWQYEVEGFKFNVNGTYYLPDFWLPQLKIFAEARPDDPAEISRAAPLLQSLATARGQASARRLPATGRGHPAEIARPPTQTELNDSWRRARELDLEFETATFERRNAVDMTVDA